MIRKNQIKNKQGMSILSMLVGVAIGSILLLAIGQLFSIAQINLVTVNNINSMSTEMTKAVRALDEHIGDMAGLFMHNLEPNTNSIDPPVHIYTRVDPANTNSDKLYAIFRNTNFNNNDDMYMGNYFKTFLSRSLGVMGFIGAVYNQNLAINTALNPVVPTCSGVLVPAGNIGINEFYVSNNNLMCNAYTMTYDTYNTALNADTVSNPRIFGTTNATLFQGNGAVQMNTVTLARGVELLRVVVGETNGALGLSVNNYFPSERRWMVYWPNIRAIQIGLIMRGASIPGYVPRDLSTAFQGWTNFRALPNFNDTIIRTAIQRTISLKSAQIPKYRPIAVQNNNNNGVIRLLGRRGWQADNDAGGNAAVVPVNSTETHATTNNFYWCTNPLVGNSSDSNSYIYTNTVDAGFHLKTPKNNLSFLDRSDIPDWIMLGDVYSDALTLSANNLTIDGISILGNVGIPTPLNAADDIYNILINPTNGIGTTDYNIIKIGTKIYIQPKNKTKRTITLSTNGGANVRLFANFRLDTQNPVGGPQTLTYHFGIGEKTRRFDLKLNGTGPYTLNTSTNLQFSTDGGITWVSVPNGTYTAVQLADAINGLGTNAAVTGGPRAHALQQLRFIIEPTLFYEPLLIRTDGANGTQVFENFQLNAGGARTFVLHREYTDSNIPNPCFVSGRNLWLY
ncbi:MAG: hypothetical protein ACKOAD_06050 [Gammaproteobacteria bacterium]